MLDFFWFKRQEMSDPRTGRRGAQVNGVNLGGIQSDNKRAHNFVGGRPANDSVIKGATR